MLLLDRELASKIKKWMLCFTVKQKSFFTAKCGKSLYKPTELYSQTGELSSPGYPNSYDNYINCYWRITVPDGLVLLNFGYFYTESGYDYVRVSRQLD